MLISLNLNLPLFCLEALGFNSQMKFCRTCIHAEGEFAVSIAEPFPLRFLLFLDVDIGAAATVTLAPVKTRPSAVKTLPLIRQ